MPKLLRPRDESPTPLMRVSLPVLATAVCIGWLGTSFDHPWVLLGPALGVSVALSWTMLRLRGWWLAITGALLILGLSFCAGFVVYLFAFGS